MKYLSILLAAVLLCNCNDKVNYPKAENAFDAGREFIDGCLKGDFDKAAFYMINDDKNNDLLLTQKRNFNDKSKAEQQQYHDASIIINEDATLNDSTHIIINYQNSFDKTGRKVKVILRNGVWLVDFKYTFDGNL